MSSAIVDDESVNEDRENWKGNKAQSMYDLQRERSLETIKATAVAINNLGAIDKKNDNDKLNETEIEQTKKRSPSRRLLITTKRIPKDKSKSITSKTNSNPSPKQNGYITTAAAASKSAQLAAAVVAGSSSPYANSTQQPSQPSLAASSDTSLDTSNSSQGQKRRPLTWAWLRGHEVNLSSPSNGADKRTVPNRMTLTRRRSLKAGNASLINRSISQQQNEWPSPIHRPSNANKLHSSTSLVNALSRRASLGRPLLAQLGAQKSIRKSDAGLAVPSNPISASGREIIQLCFEQPHNDIGARICSRLLEKRPDFRNFVYSMGKERWLQMTTRLRQFLDNVVKRVDNVEAVERLARRYGEEHVELKCYGFKPDFWVSLADAMTVECVILDQATHQPSDTITAWSLLVSLMFSAVRDGYYQAMRAQRISQRHRNVQQRELSLRLDEDVDSDTGGHSFAGVEKSASAHELQSPVKRNGSHNNAFKVAEQKSSLTTEPVKLGDKVWEWNNSL
uniref:GLOBIN domain-containing protein n=1 Tax=Meloidogyne hapla TaxID=6305 RepID=A0A1I8BR22_MELHA